MARRRLNKEGYDSYRNLAKPFRLPREIKDKKGNHAGFHPLDMMSVYDKNGLTKLINTTGCFGQVSSWGVGRLSIVIRRGAPGKQRSSRKKKKGCKLVAANNNAIQLDFNKATLQQLLNLRGDLLTIKIMGENIPPEQGGAVNLLSDGLIQILDKLTAFITNVYSEVVDQMHATDIHRRSSTIGMMKSGKVHIERIKSLDQRIKRAILNMGTYKSI